MKITDIHPDLIPEAVRNELEQTPASQLDILYLRLANNNNSNQIKDLANSISKMDIKLDGMIEAFSKQLKVEVVNGKKEERLITELIAELWEQHQDSRNVSIIRKFIYLHRRKFLVITAMLFTMLVLLKEPIHNTLEWLSKNFFDILKWIF